MNELAHKTFNKIDYCIFCKDSFFELVTHNIYKCVQSLTHNRVYIHTYTQLCIIYSLSLSYIHAGYLYLSLRHWPFMYIKKKYFCIFITVMNNFKLPISMPSINIIFKIIIPVAFLLKRSLN